MTPYPNVEIRKADNPERSFKLTSIEGNEEFTTSEEDLVAMTGEWPVVDIYHAGQFIGVIGLTVSFNPIVISRPDYHGSDILAGALNTYIKEYSHLPDAKPYLLWDSKLTPFSTMRTLITLPTITDYCDVQIHHNRSLAPIKIEGDLFKPKGRIVNPEVIAGK